MMESYQGGSSEPQPVKEPGEFDERTLSSNDKFEIVLVEKLPEDVIEPLYEVLESGFESLNEVCLGKQDMTMDEFKEDALDPSVLKFLVYGKKEAGREPMGCLFIHTDPEKVRWIDQRFYQEEFPDLFDKENFLYTSTLVMGTDSRNLSAGRMLVKAAQRYGFESHAKSILMDYSEFNSKLLPGFFEYCARKMNKDDVDLAVENIEIGKENYFLLEPQSEGTEAKPYYATKVPLNPHVAEECMALYRHEQDERLPFDERLPEELVLEALTSPDTVKLVIFEDGAPVAFSVLTDDLDDSHLNRNFVSGQSDRSVFLSSIYTTQADSRIFEVLADYSLNEDAGVVMKLDEKNTRVESDAAKAFGYLQPPSPIDRQHFVGYVRRENTE